MLFDRLAISLSSFFVEGLVILLIAPWLLFPGISPFATLLSLIILAVFLIVSWWITRLPLRPNPINGAMLIWALTFLVSILVTADASLTLPKATGLFLGFAVWRWIINNVSKRVELNWTLVVFFASGLLVTVVGILGSDWRLKLPIFESIFSSDTIFPRLITLPGGPDSGIHTNQLAGVFTLFLPIIVSLFIGAWNGRKGRLGLIMLLLGVAALSLLLLLTQSRGGWLGGTAGLMALLLLWARFETERKRKRVLLLGFVAIVLILVAGSIWLGPSRMANLWDDPSQKTAVGGLGTLGFRQEVWRWAITAIGDFPFTGTGLGTFREVVRRLYPLNISPQTDLAHAHNLFLQLALDFGIAGLISYLATIGISFFLAWRVAVRSIEFRPLGIGIIAGLVAYHVYSLTDALAPGSKPGLILWMLVAIIVVLDRFTSMADRAKGQSLNNFVDQEV